MSSIPWTDERVDRLAQLWRDGLSASEVARQLGGVTRNAVIGKLHRLGLLGGRGHATPSAKMRPARPKSPGGRRRAPRIRSEPCGATPVPDWPGEVASVEALGSHHCRWPIGDPRDEGFSFCGRWAEVGPYCPAHGAVAFVREAARPGRAP